MTKKKSNQIPRKKKIPNPATTQNNPKNPQQQKIKICHTPQFFFTSNEQDTRKKEKITKRKLTRKTKILQKNPMKYTHKKVELKKKKSSETKLLLPFSFFAVQQLVKLT